MQDMTFLRAKEVVRRTGLPRSTIYWLIREGRFPAPVKLSPRCSAWLEAEVNEWAAARVNERDAA